MTTNEKKGIIKKKNEGMRKKAECRVIGNFVGAIHESPENKRIPKIKAGEHSSPLR